MARRVELTREYTITSWSDWLNWLSLRTLLDKKGMLQSITTIERMAGRYHIEVKEYERL